MKKPPSLGNRAVYQGKVVDLRLETLELPGGQRIDLEVIRHPGASAVVPLDADGQVYLVRQYRHAASGWLLEVPAGKLDPGESPQSCALRETEEEVGLVVGRLQSLGAIWTTPGFADEQIHLFLATELSPGKQALEEDELLEIRRMPFEEALDLARRGKMQDAKSCCALFRAEALLKASRV